MLLIRLNNIDTHKYNSYTHTHEQCADVKEYLVNHTRTNKLPYKFKYELLMIESNIRRVFVQLTFKCLVIASSGFSSSRHLYGFLSSLISLALAKLRPRISVEIEKEKKKKPIKIRLLTHQSDDFVKSSTKHPHWIKNTQALPLTNLYLISLIQPLSLYLHLFIYLLSATIAFAGHTVELVILCALSNK